MADEKTWGDGKYTSDDVIESADHTAYTSTADYVAGEDGMEPDDDYAADDDPEDTDDDYDTDDDDDDPDDDY